MDSSLLSLTDDELDPIVSAFDSLCGLQAAIRRTGSTDHSVSFGPTGAAKILHALRPEALLPWDEPIRKRLRLSGDGASYRRFVVRTQALLRHLVEEAGTYGIGPRALPATIGRPESSLPKLIDEFLWVTITRKVVIPTPTELGTLARWAAS